MTKRFSLRHQILVAASRVRLLSQNSTLTQKGGQFVHKQVSTRWWNEVALPQAGPSWQVSPSHTPLASADTSGLSQLTARVKNQFNQPPDWTPNLERLPGGGRRNTNLTKTQRARNSDSPLLLITRKSNKPPRCCSQTIRQQQEKQMRFSLFPTCTHLAPGQTSLTKDINSNLRSSWLHVAFLRVAFLPQRPLECSKGQGRLKERGEKQSKAL